MVTIGIHWPGATVTATSYNGKAGKFGQTKMLQLMANENRYYTELSEIQFDPAQGAVQWINTKEDCVANGLLVRPALNGDEENAVNNAGETVFDVIVMDASISDPFISKRRDKVKALLDFSENKLKPLMTSRQGVAYGDISVVVFYSGDMADLPTKLSNGHASCSENTRKSFQDNVWIVDKPGCLQLGTRF